MVHEILNPRFLWFFEISILHILIAVQTSWTRSVLLQLRRLLDGIVVNVPKRPEINFRFGVPGYE